MKKRILAMLLCITILTISLYGCKSSNNNDTNSATPEVTNAAVSGDAQVTPEPVEYMYEQELNIINDNYRNYYEIFVASFCDSDGDGSGDMNGIISKLDYIKEMGFNGIWLMPIMPSPSYHKYDATNYYTIDSKYGTLEDFQNLLKECHDRDIKLIIDYVFNHTSTQHPWFKEAVTYLQTLGEGEEPDPSVCPSVEYYHFITDGASKNNYLKIGNSNWYYECVFGAHMPDLALENASLRAELEKNAKFWLDMGVDGFRLDAAKEYYTGDTSKNTEVLKWFSDYVISVKPDAYLVAEVWDAAPLIASLYESGITSIFNYPLAQYNGIITSSVRKLGIDNAKSFVKNVLKNQALYAASNPNFIDSPFISNHDNTRVSAQCGNNENQMKMAAGMLLTMNGSPFVYYGEEIGMNSMGDKDENKRLPMNWSKTDTTGITNPPPAADEVEQQFAPLDEQLQDPLSIVNYYKRALRIRNENPEIARGEMTAIDELLSQNIAAVKKVYEGSEIVIVYNIHFEGATVDLNTVGYGDLAIRGYLTVDGSEVTMEDGVLNMPLYSIVILKK